MIVRNMHIPYILGKEVLELNVDVQDNQDYENTATYYNERTLTQYAEFVLGKSFEYRGCSESNYSHLARGYIATSTRYKASRSMRNGTWGFTIKNTYYEGNYVGGKIFSYYYFYHDTGITIVQIIQPIINY